MIGAFGVDQRMLLGSRLPTYGGHHLVSPASRTLTAGQYCAVNVCHCCLSWLCYRTWRAGTSIGSEWLSTRSARATLRWLAISGALLSPVAFCEAMSTALLVCVLCLSHAGRAGQWSSPDRAVQSGPGRGRRGTGSGTQRDGVGLWSPARAVQYGPGRGRRGTWSGTQRDGAGDAEGRGRGRRGTGPGSQRDGAGDAEGRGRERRGTGSVCGYPPAPHSPGTQRAGVAEGRGRSAGSGSDCRVSAAVNEPL